MQKNNISSYLLLIVTITFVSSVSLVSPAFAEHDEFLNPPVLWEFNSAEITQEINQYRSMVQYNLDYIGTTESCSISIMMLVEPDTTGLPEWMKQQEMGSYITIADRDRFDCNTNPTIDTGVALNETISFLIELKEESKLSTLFTQIYVNNYTFTDNIPGFPPLPAIDPPAEFHTMRVPKGDVDFSKPAIPIELQPPVNPIGSQPPVMDRIYRQTGFDGTPISFQVNATDPDTRTQDLEFWIPQNNTLFPVPDGVSITESGFFTWTPNNQVGQYQILIKVIDPSGNHHGSRTQFVIKEPLPTTSPLDIEPAVKKNNSDNREKIPPTLGEDKNRKSQVDNGFTYNNNTVNVQYGYTPFPLITTEVGKKNTIELVIYENEGKRDVGFVYIGFGLENIKTNIYKSEAMIKYNFRSTNSALENLSTIDKNNILQNVNMTSAEPHKCKSTDVKLKCLKMVFEYENRESTVHNVLAVQLGDENGNKFTYYFNDGIEVIGESLNGPLIEVVSGIEYTRTDKVNNIWENDGIEYKQVSKTLFNEINPVDYRSYKPVCNDTPLDQIKGAYGSENCHFRALAPGVYMR